MLVYEACDKFMDTMDACIDHEVSCIRDYGNSLVRTREGDNDIHTTDDDRRLDRVSNVDDVLDLDSPEMNDASQLGMIRGFQIAKAEMLRIIREAEKQEHTANNLKKRMSTGIQNEIVLS